MNHRINRLLMTLAVLLAVTTGAWAQEPTVHTGQVDISELNENDILAEGCSVTGDYYDKIILFDNGYKQNGELQTEHYSHLLENFFSFGENGVISRGNDDFAPADLYGDDGNAWLVMSVSNDGIFFVIELSGIYYDPNGVALNTYIDDRTVWTIDKMPASDVELTVRYFPDATVGGTATAATGVHIGENKALVSGLSTKEGTLVYAITADDVDTAPADADFAAAYNTAKDLTEAGKYRVWYFATGNATRSPSDPVYAEVTVLPNKFDIAFTSANANTIQGGKATVKVGDNPATPDADGKISGVTMGQTVTITAKDGYKFLNATAIDGRTVYTSEVAVSSLQEGDILAEGATITNPGNDKLIFPKGRMKSNGKITTSDVIVNILTSLTLGKNSSIKFDEDDTSTPVDGSGQDCNAWEVTKDYETLYEVIYLSGITYPTVVPLNATKTATTLTMPASNVALSYDLRRDMNVKVTAKIGERIRIKKDNNAYVAAIPAEIIPAVTDIIGSTAVTMTDGDYDLQLQKLGDDSQTWTDATALSVGTFRYKVTGTNLYDGVIYTNNFQLFEGYEVTVPAGEYITYYKDEALTLDTDETQAQLYTITAVSETTATATPFDVIPANVPLLLKNTATETRSILLIPTETTDVVNYYDGFKGTLAATTIAASDATTDRYAFNGKQFVWVKNDLAVGANKAWLEIPAAASNARAITLVFGDATGLSEELRVKSEEFATATWYDLNGRKLNGIPTKKGVYIQRSAEGRLQGKNGKKVVVK